MNRLSYAARSIGSILLLLFTLAAEAQVSAGISANGRPMNQGDTVQVCQGGSVLFASRATGSLDIRWRFRTGSPNAHTGSGPVTVIYNTIGIDSAFQRVDGSAGFADSTFVIVKVSDDRPTARFNFAPNGECANIPINFTSTSTGTAPLTYLWHFGDNTTSIQQNPSHAFLSAVGNATQDFQVKLVVTNAAGCKDSSTQTVRVRQTPSAAMGNAAAPGVTFSTFNGVPTFRSCSIETRYLFQFRNASTTIPDNVSYLIKWGDGSPDSTFTNWPAGQIITHVFPRGSSTMTIEVLGSTGCKGITTYNVFLGTTPSGGLVSQGNEDICSSAPLSFDISGISNNPPGTEYIFYANDGSAQQVFQHAPPATVSHFFATGSCGISSSNGVNSYQNAYAVYMDIVNPCGTKSSAILPIYVSGKPRAGISTPSPVVCVGANVPIQSTSVYGNTISSTGAFTSTCASTGIQVWEITPATGWALTSGSLGNYGGQPTNGFAWTTGTVGLNANFNTPGTYTIKLSIFNERCGMVSTTQTICVRNPPTASFTLPQKRSCGPADININNTTPAGGCQGNSYRWDITYSNPLNCPVTPGGTNFDFINNTSAASQSPSIRFNKGGRYIIRLTSTAINAGNYCQPATAVDTFFVVGPPVANMPVIPGVCAGNTVSPTATVLNCYGAGPLTYQWNFTSGTPATSTSLNPGAILFNTAGTHNVQFIVKDESCNLSDTIGTTVTIGNRPVAEAGDPREICSGENTTIGMTPVSGVTYSWFPSTGLSSATAANPSLTLTYTGISVDTVYKYYLTAAQGSNCTSLDSVLIRVKRRPIVTVNPSAISICGGDTITLTANGAANYVWSPTTFLSANTGASVQAWPASSTTVTVTGDIGNGCPDTRSIVITVRTKPTADVGTPLNICSGESGVLGVVGTSGVTSTWSPSTGLSNSNIANPTVTLTYNGVQTDTTYKYYLLASVGSNCSSLDSVEVMVRKRPVLVVTPVTTAICTGDTIVLNASGADTYTWSPAAGLSATTGSSVNAFPLQTTTYTVIGRLNNGCTDQRQITITVRNTPVADAGNDLNICSGETRTLGVAGAPGIVYQWTPANGLSNTSIANPVFNGVYNGSQDDTIYKYQLTASLGSFCSSTDSVTVRVRRSPIVTLTPAMQDLCTGDTVILTASGADNYAWTPNTNLSATSGDIVRAWPLNTITYTVTGSLNNGCSQQRSAQITVRPKPVAEAGPDREFCSVAVVSIGAPPLPGITYTWSPAAGLSNPNIAMPQVTMVYNGPNYDTVVKYYVTAALGTYCSSMDSVTVTINRSPVVTVTPNIATICSGDAVTLTASGADDYTWTPAAGLSANNTTSVTANPSATMTYTVIGELDNGCTHSTQATVNVSSHALAQMSASQTILCAPVNINTILSVVPYPLRNSSYQWYADDVPIGSNTTGVVPSYNLVNYGDTVDIKLVALSALNCKADSVTIRLITRPSITADFDMSVREGCSPLLVNFTNTTPDYVGASYSWNFGNGSTANTRDVAGATYFESPIYRDTTYYIRLTVNNGCVNSTKLDSVKVYPSSQARFNVNNPEGCSPFNVIFTNTSRGNNTAYYWDFGDGRLDTTYANGTLTHTYITGTIRTFTAQLISENRCGRDTQTLNVQVSPNSIQVLLQANGDQLAGCVPHTVTFNNTSVGAAFLTWNFGDGSPEVTTPNDQTTVTHTYLNTGQFTVRVRLQNSCSDTLITRVVNVYRKPIAQFNAVNPVICPGSTIIFNNTSQFADGYQWFWGDGQQSTGVNASHAYANAGNYTVTLVASTTYSPGFSCTDTTRRTVAVKEKIAARILATTNRPCAPFAFTASAEGAATADRVDWVITNTNNPQSVSQYTGINLAHAFVNPGIYRVKMIVHTAPECKDSTTMDVEVFPTPFVTHAPMRIATCSHDTLINFTATPQYEGTDLLQYRWYVNGQQEGVGNPYAHRFMVPYSEPNDVTFSVRVSAENGAGCSDTSDAGQVIIYALPIPTVQVTPGYVQQQPNYTFGFSDTKPADPNKIHTWTMGDHTLREINGQSISYTYGDTGVYIVRLHVKNFQSGCEARDSTEVTILPVPGYLHVPNAMCMGCANNALRRFLPMGKGLIQYRLSIYTTWGQKVFESTSLDADGSPNEAWDGTMNGKPLQQDAYTWQIEARYKNGAEWKGMLYPGSSKAIKTGFITIIK